MASKKVLGRGLSAFFPEHEEKEKKEEQAEGESSSALAKPQQRVNVCCRCRLTVSVPIRINPAKNLMNCVYNNWLHPSVKTGFFQRFRFGLLMELDSSCLLVSA